MFWSSNGVPSIPNLPKNVGDAVIKYGGALAINTIFGNYWGIFDQNGIPLLLADSVKSVQFRSESKISSAPLEQGSFTSYNKVVEPYTANVMMTKGSGGVIERGAFLALLDGFKNSTDLFMVITPEAVYPNCNILGYDYVREAGDGARMIKVNIRLQEVREVTAEYSETQMPESTKTVNNGTVEASQITKHSDNRSIAKKLADEIGDKGFIEGVKSAVGDILGQLKDEISGVTNAL